MINNRTVSGFPLSIGTGIAFESLFNIREPVYDPNRVTPPKVNLSIYSEIWVNVSTLYRNMVGSMPSADSIQVTDEDYYHAIAQELDVISSLCQNEGGGKIKPVYYACTYDHLYKHPGDKSIKMRQESTPKALSYVNKLIKVIHALKKDGVITLFDSELKPNGNPKALILTHSAWDLTSQGNFNKLDLIESHTGVVKTRDRFNTKYHKYKDLSNLPFNKKLLKVFGDSEIFVPAIKEFRDAILVVSVKGKWTPLTTKDKMMLDLSTYMVDKYALSVLMHL